MEEIEKLEAEIVLLKKRIDVLEKTESRRKALKYFKILIKVLVIGALIFGIWKSYDYVVNGIPNLIEEKIKDINPFKKK